MVRLRRAAILLTACAALAAHGLAQCAMCRENVLAAKEGGDSGLADGIHESILFMLSLPLLVGGSFCFALWRAGRAARREAGFPRR